MRGIVAVIAAVSVLAGACGGGTPEAETERFCGRFLVYSAGFIDAVRASIDAANATDPIQATQTTSVVNDLESTRLMAPQIFSEDIVDDAPENLRDDVDVLLKGLRTAVEDGDTAPLDTEGFTAAAQRLQEEVPDVCADAGG